MGVRALASESLRPAPGAPLPRSRGGDRANTIADSLVDPVELPGTRRELADRSGPVGRPTRTLAGRERSCRSPYAGARRRVSDRVAPASVAGLRSERSDGRGPRESPVGLTIACVCCERGDPAALAEGAAAGFPRRISTWRGRCLTPKELSEQRSPTTPPSSPR
jgi:hypothetical protein